MEVYLIKALQLMLCFAILVILHEGGHFFFAKLFKVRVEKFCLFFDPWFTPFKFKPKNSDTTYCIGWLPLGGYVKISGMIDESMDKEQMKKPAQKWEFRSKPAWQRLFIMLGGVLVNFFLAFFIYAMLLFFNGETYIPMKNMTQGMAFNETAQQYGFRNGDILLKSNIAEFQRFDSNNSIGDVYRNLSEATEVTVLRGTEEVTINLPGNLNMLEMIKSKRPFINIYAPAIIDSVLPNSIANKIGLTKGDRIVGINNKKIETNLQFLSYLANEKALANAPEENILNHTNFKVMVEKAQSNKIDTMNVAFDSNFVLGVYFKDPRANYKTVTKTYSFAESFPAGIEKGWGVLTGYVNDLKYLFTKDGAQSMGSFLTIGSLFPSTWNWSYFWELTAFISLILAFMNILPIPALDGGHVLFLLYEIIIRKTPSEKFMEYAQLSGMAILLLLMFWAMFNDVVRFLF